MRRLAEIFYINPIRVMELIQPYTIAPWEARMRMQIDGHEASPPKGVRIGTSSSARNGVVGMGDAVSDATAEVLNGPVLYSMNLGRQTE